MTTLRVLHISDLHFGVIKVGDGSTRSAHYFTRQDDDNRPDPQQLARLLRRDIATYPPQLIVVSGDVAWSGHHDDYELATEFLRSIQENAPDASLIIAPGNHDVDHATTPEGRQDAFIKMLKDVYGEPKFAELYPLYNTGSSSRDLLIAVTEVYEDKASSTPSGIVVAFNSAAGLQEKNTPVRIEPFALTQLDEHLETTPPSDNILRICVLHHHLFPFAEPSRRSTSDTRHVSEDQADPDLLANSAKLQGWLAQHKFHMVLHGHKHTSHGREDLLWRRSDRSGRRLLVIGAGSASVEDGHRAQSEPLSFNRITATRLSSERWQIDVDVREIRVDTGPPSIDTLYPFRSTAGGPASEVGDLPIFRAENMDDCHQAIALATKDRGLQQGFLSVVENSRYMHPRTASFRGESTEEHQVRNCFRQLHPEYDERDQWDNSDDYDHRLHQAQLRYRFEHGSRLFGSPDRRTRRKTEDVRQTSPMLRVVEELRTNRSTSKAYVGLYRPEIDLLSAGSEPLPGMMSLQFMWRGATLDITVTFRKIELSFWWCVNMMEASELLHWVAGRVGATAGKISFFAALAEWKTDPEAAVEAVIDGMSISKMIELTLESSWSTLAELLVEKAALTNENNLDPTGLARLAEIFKGCIPKIDESLRQSIDELTKQISIAREAIDTARTSTDGRPVRNARSALQGAITILQRISQPLV